MFSLPRLLMYGFALFAMFFGSGNIVFPLEIGYSSGTQWVSGFLGFLSTGVVLPFLGLFVIKQYQGDYRLFFGQAGPLAGALLPFITLSLLGAFGVVPRCITVAYGGLQYLFPSVSMAIFSVLFCIITFICCLNEDTLMSLLGRWLSPLKISALLALIIVGIQQAPPLAPALLNTPPLQVFAQGFMSGYQTMDLFAAFFFSSFVFQQMSRTMPAGTSTTVLIRFAIQASLLGSLLITAVYVGFIYLGAHYAFLLQDVPPTLILPQITQYTMGHYATMFIALTMLLACFTTAVTLNNIYTRYLQDLLSIPPKWFPAILALSTSVTFAISLMDFKNIVAFLAPILEMTYPGLILLTIMSILSPEHREMKKWFFWAATLGMIAYRCL